jgi:molecular chaperone HtpG
MDENKTFESGSISIAAENMFPIIKKWLYSEKDIFIRELVSNCSDAISKLERLRSLGQAEDDGEAFRITVKTDAEAGTLSFADNGIGMTADEVKKYINQVAFSGAKDFFETYKDAGDASQIIGHFGLGFYSAFMAAKKVTIETKSFAPGSEAVRWVSESGMEYTLEPCEKSTRGTLVTLELADDSKEYAQRWNVHDVLMKYFRFLSTPVYLEDASEEPKEDAKPVNADAPLWEKAPSECTDEEYRDFYHKLFMDVADPLFWVHLNIDYPFRLKGILYFPKLKNEFESVEGQVKLYCSRVFVADNIKEVIPEYLLLLKGCIDCPDLPLNVSRSFLQNDGTVTRISSHITRKVADRLLSLFKNEREQYNKYWDDINPFIKYGCLRDEKFYERVKLALIFKFLDGTYKTVDEYLPEAPKEETEENPTQQASPDSKVKTIYYVTDEKAQAQYIAMFAARGIEAVILNHSLDNAFISMLESKNRAVRFRRIDADISELKDQAAQAGNDAALETLFGEIAGGIKVETAALGEAAAPAVLTLSEEGRRMQEMARLFGGPEGMADMYKAEYTLVLNSAHTLYQKLEALKDADADTAKLLAQQIYDLARLAQRPLESEDMTAFIARSAQIMEKLG